MTMRRILLILPLAALLLFAAAPALADGALLIDATATQSVTTSEVYVNVTCPAQGTVTVTVSDEHGAVYYEGLRGDVSGWFYTGDLYLPLQEGTTRYRVDVSSEAGAYSVDVTRTQPRIAGVKAYAAGFPLSTVYSRAGNVCVTLVTPSDGDVTVPLVAGGIYRLGSVILHVSGGTVTAEAVPEEGAGAEITAGRVYLASGVEDVMALADGRFTGAAGALGMPMSLGDAEVIAVMVELTVSFDPASLHSTTADPQPGQTQRWQRMVDLDEDTVG